MTTTISYALGDGYIRSNNASYATARTGSNLLVVGTGANVRVGQDLSGGSYFYHEGFFRFGYTRDTAQKVVAAYIDLFCTFALSPGVSRSLGVRQYDWNEPLGTDNFLTATQINAQTRYGFVGSINTAGGLHAYAQEPGLNDWLEASTGDRQIIVYNDRMTAGIAPAGAEYNDFNSVEAAGTAEDPALVYSSVPVHSLMRVGGCQVMLSDGQHIYIEADDGTISTGTGDPLLTLKRFDGTTHTTLATNLMSSARDMGSSNHGFQSYALVRDNSDNFYWIGHAAFNANTLTVVCWKKTGTNVWTEQSPKQADMPATPGTPVINNLAAAWHSVGTSGTIVVVGGHDNVATDSSPTDEVFYALLNCQYLLTGVGSLLRGSGDAFAAGLITPWSRSGDYNMPVNPVGTCLDIVALPNSADRGAIISLSRASPLGSYATIGIVRYILNSTGTGFANTDDASDIDLWSTKDAGAKARVLPISDTRFVIATLDQDSGWGPTLRVAQNIGTSATFTELGGVLLHGESIASLPAPSTMHDKQTWDAIYHPDANKVYFYYFDTANAFRLMRTTFDLATYQAVRDEIQVQASVGAAGSVNHAIRVDRGRLTKSEAMIAVANRSSGGVWSTIYIKDTLNVAPLAPSLVDKANYDATTGSLFDWTFNDLNVGDTQTAYEFQIDNADTLASVVATGKVVSAVTERNVTGGTLANGINYRWRVRTWDASDVVGAWSGYDFFTTSASGSLNITDPATDNPANIIRDDYTFVWSVTGLTQTKYRVRVVNNITGVQISDTGFLTSTATSHLVTAMASDVEHRIEITAQNASAVNTNTATRLITPNYNEPEIPTVAVSALDDQGHILVDIVNPVPQGDKPEVTSNNIQRRRTGESDWVTIATVAYNGSYQDWHTGSGIEYEYKVVAVATTGFSESPVYPVTLQLLGVWLHVPSDPAGTARNYMFGANQRGATHTSYSELTHYAGREFPVADFAHYHDQTYNVVVDIPYGDDYYDQLDGLHALENDHSTLVYRDNRRRNAFGVMQGGFSESDQPWGTQVSFDFTQVHYNEEVV